MTTLTRVRLGDCLEEVTQGVGPTWHQYRVVGATRAGLAPGKEKVGKKPERYKLVAPGTIFYNPMRILLGSIAMIDEGEEAGITSPDYVVFRPRPGVIHHRWLYYWLRSNQGAAFIKTLTRGAVRERLLFRRLAPAQIPLPGYRVQRSFAEEMTILEGARSAAQARLEAHQELETAFLRRSFFGMTPLAASGPRATSPSGWSWKSLGDIARLESGHTPSRRRPEWWGGDIPWIALPDIRALDGLVAQDTIERTNLRGIANSSARVLPRDTVVLSRTASVGFATIMGREMATSQDFVNWVCGPELEPRFLLHLLRASRNYIVSLASGAVHKTVYIPTVKAFDVCVPRLSTQQDLVAALDRKLADSRSLADSLGQELAAIESLRSALLEQTALERDAG